MPIEGDEQFVIGNKCLEFCQALTSHGQKFSFSLNIGSNFSFSQNTKVMLTSLDASKVTILQKGMKNKLSPSQVRRKLKRKEELLRRKSKNSMTEQLQQDEKDFMCDQCKTFSRRKKIWMFTWIWCIREKNLLIKLNKLVSHRMAEIWPMWSCTVSPTISLEKCCMVLHCTTLHHTKLHCTKMY